MCQVEKAVESHIIWMRKRYSSSPTSPGWMVSRKDKQSASTSFGSISLAMAGRRGCHTQEGAGCVRLGYVEVRL